MVRIAPVNLSNNPKTLWFDAGELDINEGDGVVVTTARGTEFGHLAAEIFDASEDQVEKLKTPLKPVIRVATPEDEVQAEELLAKSAEALPVFKEMAAEMNESMRPVSVEYLFDGDKAVFYFEAEDRVDFRELVRKLAAYFHVRIDMRQIGVRDEARLIGGLGHCGQELCCKRLGGEFCPVSIRMAKEQDLSLNPQKISGVCGRLMCCLRYEYDAYKDFNKRAPKRSATVQTPDGPAKVVDLDVPREVVIVRIEGEKPVRIPLANFDPVQGEGRPSVVGKEAWETALEQSRSTFGSVSATLLAGQLSAHDTLADPVAVRRTGSATGGNLFDATEVSEVQDKTTKPEKHEKAHRSAKRAAKQGVSITKNQDKTVLKNSAGRKRVSVADMPAEQEAAAAAPARTPRRRRSTKLDVGSAVVVTQAKEASCESRNQQKDNEDRIVRAGRGARKVQAGSNNRESHDNRDTREVQETREGCETREVREGRTSRNRSRVTHIAAQRKNAHDVKGDQRAKRQKDTQNKVKTSGESAQSEKHHRTTKPATPERVPRANKSSAQAVAPRADKPAVRPGQKSSGVRKSHEVHANNVREREQIHGAANVSSVSDAQRQSRRRRRNRRPAQEKE